VTAIWHYARGRALVATARLAEAERERDSVAAIAAALPADRMVSVNSGRALLAIAERMLTGELAAKRGDDAGAVQALEDAVRREDALGYDEPPTWDYPARHSLGAVLLAAHRAGDAERVYREDLRRHPANGWALFGLAASLRAQGRLKEAADAERRFAAAWARSDVRLTASRF
jgi:tetratricopeptide (TPR) repeat protein